MATILNIAKDAIKKNNQAKSAREAATLLKETKNGEEHVVGIFTDKIEKASRLTTEANAQCKIVQKELEKDSRVREKFAAMIEEGERFQKDVDKIIQ